MMPFAFSPFLLSILGVLAVSAVSLIGVVTLSLRRETLKRASHVLVALAAGSLFGDAFIHLIPQSFKVLGFGLLTSLLFIFGFFAFFVLEKIIRWRHCHSADCEEHSGHIASMNLIGDGVHNFLDGVVISASFMVSNSLGVATLIAVFFHEIPQELGDFGVLIHSGYSVAKALLFNFISALVGVLGVFFTFFLSPYFPGLGIYLVPISAGGFLYIAGSDLIPELHKETGGRKAVLDLTALLSGILFMVLLTFVE